MSGSLPGIRHVVDTYGLLTQKKLGQHFLYDLNITDKIVRCAGTIEGKTILEIGPGPGALTRSLLQADPKALYAIDMDLACIEALRGYLLPCYPRTLTLLHGDALDDHCYEAIHGSVKIIANLPYNVATAILLQSLKRLEKIESMTLMFQREVVERIVASPGSKDYGRLAIKVQRLCAVKKKFDIPASAFFPPPKVFSSVVHIEPYPTPKYAAHEKILDELCRLAFGQRRKLLRNSLKDFLGEAIDAILSDAGIDGRKRPEQLTIEEFCRLSQVAAAYGITCS